MSRNQDRAASRSASSGPRLWTGTSGFSYKEWKGSFYPEKLPASRMLEHYAARLSSVEINNTFYRLPRAEMLEKWAAQVPEDFAFVLKASRRITHMKRLKDADDPLEYLVRTATAALGSRLGPILFQLPPYLRADMPRLKAFLEIVPRTVRAAFEFRHESWFADDVYEALADHGAALVTADTGEGEAPVVETASFGYARLRRPGYEAGELAAWADALRRDAWSDVFVFFKHEGRGGGAKDGGGVPGGVRLTDDRTGVRTLDSAGAQASPADLTVVRCRPSRVHPVQRTPRGEPACGGAPRGRRARTAPGRRGAPGQARPGRSGPRNRSWRSRRWWGGRA